MRRKPSPCVLRVLFLNAMITALLLAGPVAAESNATNGELVILTVIKKKLTAELRTLPQPGFASTLLKRFRIALGKKDGDKEKEGDNKTPEGIYFTRHHIDGKTLPAKYGSFAIPINFPNPVDRLAGKTGYGIWLHGVQEAQRIDAARVTEGCVAFYNEDISSLSSWLKPFQGIVAITKDYAQLNRTEDVKTLMSLTQHWAESWALRDHEQYSRFYHRDFSYKQKNMQQYLEYKKRVFSSYKTMDLAVYDTRVITHPKYAVSILNQDFNGDNRFISKGRKILYWLKNDQGEYKIISEDFQNNRFRKINQSVIETLASQGTSELPDKMGI